MKRLLVLSLCTAAALLALALAPPATALERPREGVLRIENDLVRLPDGHCAGGLNVTYGLRAVDVAGGVQLAYGPDCSVTPTWVWDSQRSSAGYMRPYKFLQATGHMFYLNGQRVEGSIVLDSQFAASAGCGDYPAGAAQWDTHARLRLGDIGVYSHVWPYAYYSGCWAAYFALWDVADDVDWTPHHTGGVATMTQGGHVGGCARVDQDHELYVDSHSHLSACYYSGVEIKPANFAPDPTQALDVVLSGTMRDFVIRPPL